MRCGSERRDRLTRTFYLLCLAFSVFLAPPPQLQSGAARGAYELASLLAQLFLGPLFSHFFALFPESGRLRARAWVLAGYAAATVLFTLYFGVQLESAFGSGLGRVLVPGPADVSTYIQALDQALFPELRGLQNRRLLH